MSTLAIVFAILFVGFCVMYRDPRKGWMFGVGAIGTLLAALRFGFAAL